MKKLHICMISSEFPPQSAGIGYAAFHLARALVKNGHTVSVITRGSWRNNNTYNIEGITVHQAFFIPLPPPIHIFIHTFFVRKIFKKFESTFNIVHLHSPLIPHVSTTLPKVVTVHSTWHVESESFVQKFDWYSVAVKLFKHSFIHNEKKQFIESDAIIAISPEMSKEIINHYGINKAKVTTILNGIDITQFEHKIPVKTEQMNILAIGRLVYRKGILDLIDAARIVCDVYPKTQFSVIGEGPLEKKMKAKIHELHLEKNFLLVGKVENQHIKEYIQKSTIFVVPSHYEGLPIVLLEALACGKTVVGTDIHGIREVIDHNVNGILTPAHNPTALANVLVYLTENRKTLAELESGASVRIKDFDISESVKKVLNTYQMILKKNENK